MSPRRYRVVITETAHAEFADILAYTEEEWGTEQRDAYRDMFVGAMERLSRTPLLGRPREDARSDLRSMLMSNHLIWYSVSDDVIYVRRVLHNRRQLRGIDWDT